MSGRVEMRDVPTLSLTLSAVEEFKDDAIAGAAETSLHHRPAE